MAWKKRDESAKTPPAAPAGSWISIGDVAHKLGRSIKTIENYMRNTEMGFPRPKFFGARRYFSAAEFAAWEAQFSDGFQARPFPPDDR
jgi:predicted DNA-binding transcriptional regulator AlpA